MKSIEIEEEELHDLYIKFFKEHYLSATIAAKRYGVSDIAVRNVILKKKKLLDVMVMDMGFYVKGRRTVYTIKKMADSQIEANISKFARSQSK